MAICSRFFSAALVAEANTDKKDHKWWKASKTTCDALAPAAASFQSGRTASALALAAASFQSGNTASASAS